MSRPSRSGLERSLNYGSLGLRRFQRLILNAYLFLAICGALIFLSAIIFGSSQLATVGICVLVFFGPPLFFGWMTLREMEMRRIDVNDAGIIIDDGRKREDFQFDEMKAVEFVWIPYLVFKVKFLMNDGRKLVLPAIVERLDYPLDLLSNARPDLTSDPSFLHYRRIAISLDHAWARMGQVMSNPVRGAVAAFSRLLFTIVCAAGITSVGQAMGWFPQIERFSSFLLWSLDVIVMSVVVWLFSYGVYETRFYIASMKRLKDDPYSVKRDMKYESQVRSRMVRWTYAGSFLMAVAVALLASADIREYQKGGKTASNAEPIIEKTNQVEQASRGEN